MKRKIYCLTILITFIVNIFLPSFAYNTNQYKIFNELSSMISTNDEPSDNSRITLLRVKNINLESLDQYQWIHDNLQTKYPEKKIFDIYTNISEKVIVPDIKPEKLNDDTTKYNQQDYDFINKLSLLGITNVSIIDKTKNTTIPSIYYDHIISTILKFYQKYFYLTNKCINCSTGLLFSGFEISEIKSDKNAVGEFKPLEDKMVLDPKLFYETTDINILNERKKLIEYTINHEMGHAIELKICKEIFKNLNSPIISKKDMEKLSIMYFSGNTEVSKIIEEDVLNKIHAPFDIVGRQKFIEDNLSKYANTNPSEFLAEAIAYANSDKKDSDIPKLVEECIVNIFKQEGEVTEKIKASVLRFLSNDIEIKNVY